MEVCMNLAFDVTWTYTVTDTGTTVGVVGAGV
jgi:hypothetical protein